MKHTKTHSARPAAVASSTAVSRNRQDMPKVVAAVDQLRAIFGQVRGIYAAEGGRELGKVPDPGVIAHPPHVPSKSRKRRRL